MVEIKLSNGGFTLVSSEGYERFGHFCWRKNNKGYVVRNVFVKKVRGIAKSRYHALHREIMGNPPGLYIDHIDGNPLNNLRENLRLATNSQNQANRKALPIGSSKFRGVTWNKNLGKWQASIKVAGKSLHLGVFADEIEAALAYIAAAKKHFGEYANQAAIELVEIAEANRRAA